MNLQALFPESSFEVGGKIDRRSVRDGFEERRSREEFSDLPEVFGVVGSDTRHSVRDQSAMKRNEKVAANEAAAGVASFRPGIGKEEIKHSYGLGRHQLLDRVRNLEAQDARIAETIPLNLSTRAPDSASEPFDPEKIVLWILHRQRRQEGAVAAAEIDFQRRVATEDGRQVERSETIRRDELDLVVYGNGRIGGHGLR
jgi:hypothetical protein